MEHSSDNKEKRTFLLYNITNFQPKPNNDNENVKVLKSEQDGALTHLLLR